MAHASKEINVNVLVNGMVDEKRRVAACLEEMTTQQFRLSIGTRISVFRIIRSFASVQTAKSIHRVIGLGAGLDECLFGEYQFVAQLSFEKETWR
jgi:hypothetical protein